MVDVVDDSPATTPWILTMLGAPPRVETELAGTATTADLSTDSRDSFPRNEFDNLVVRKKITITDIEDSAGDDEPVEYSAEATTTVRHRDDDDSDNDEPSKQAAFIARQEMLATKAALANM
jgi:hypothetical protein